jgi:hypothetical protein
LASSFVRDLDQQIMGALTSAQESIANSVLATANNVKIIFDKKKGLSENDMASLTRSRLDPIASALGFRNVSSVGDLQSAAGAQKTIQGIQAGPLGSALSDINDQFSELTATASKFGIALDGVGVAQQRAQAMAINQNRLEIHALDEMIGNVTPLQRALGDLAVQFENAGHEAGRLGRSTANLQREYEEAAAEIVRQANAVNDAALLGAMSPFEQMLAPLRQLGIELNTSLLNPMQQFEAAAQNFRDVANAAASGSTDAIQQFDEAAKSFIQTATTVGASPGQVAAVQEVQAARDALVAQLEDARRESQRGFERMFQIASDREVDTLRELIAEVRILAKRLAT